MFANLLWGSAFPSIKTGYRLFEIASEDSASQILFAGTRFTLAGVLTILIFSVLNHRFIKLEKAAFPSVIKLSLFQTVFHYIFFYIALAHIAGVKASIISASSGFFAIIFSAVLLKSETNIARKLLWCVPGFLGVMLVNLTDALTFDFSLQGEGFILFSTVCGGIATMLIKKYGRTYDPVMMCGYQFFFGGLMMCAAGLLLGGSLHASVPYAWLLILYLAFVSSAAYSVWSLLLKYHPVSKVSVYAFSNPVFGTILSALILHEALSVPFSRVLISLALVCIGIYQVNKA